MGKEKNKNNGGRPSLFKEEYIDLAYNYCLLGSTDAELAIFFNVTEQTVNNWKIEYPMFFESIKRGKEEADAVIARRLFDRAYGATIKTQQAFKTKSVTYNNKGQRTEVESIEVVDLLQEQPPDTTAAIFWLKNRSPKRWRDKQVTEHEGDVVSTINIVPMNDVRQAFASNEREVDE